MVKNTGNISKLKDRYTYRSIVSFWRFIINIANYLLISGSVKEKPWIRIRLRFLDGSGFNEYQVWIGNKFFFVHRTRLITRTTRTPPIIIIILPSRTRAPTAKAGWWRPLTFRLKRRRGVKNPFRKKNYYPVFWRRGAGGAEIIFVEPVYKL